MNSAAVSACPAAEDAVDSARSGPFPAAPASTGIPNKTSGARHASHQPDTIMIENVVQRKVNIATELRNGKLSPLCQLSLLFCLGKRQEDYLRSFGDGENSAATSCTEHGSYVPTQE